MDKVSVKGSDMCAVYQFLTQKAKNGVSYYYHQKLLHYPSHLQKRAAIHRPTALNHCTHNK
jgi:hypothetical protein